MRTRLIFHIFVAIIVISCRKGDFGEVRPDEPIPLFNKNGLWVVNEGLFGFGNGEVSFIDLQNDIIYNSVFAANNFFPPGDIPFSMFVDESIIILVVNNANKIYVLNRDNFVVKYSINTIVSPRYIKKISTNQYVVSSFANDSIYFLDMNIETPKVSSLYLGKSSESMVFYNNILYAANWSAFGGSYDNTTVQIINPFAKMLIGQIQVGKEPNSMVVDKNGNIWVLCSGGFMNEENPKLFVISTLTNTVISEFQFPIISQSPNSLSINTRGDVLYFINDNIYKMNISDNTLPDSSFIDSEGKKFYNINASIYGDTILITDAKNYQFNGIVYLVNIQGEIIKSYEAEIMPSYISGNW